MRRSDARGFYLQKRHSSNAGFAAGIRPVSRPDYLLSGLHHSAYRHLWIEFQDVFVVHTDTPV